MAATSIFACFPPVTRGKPSAFSTDSKGKLLVYALDRTVVLREVVPQPGRPIHVQLYTQHGYQVTACAISPSGCYVCSGDINGNVRVWACDNPDQVCKLETTVFAGRVNGIAWSPDNTRIACVGDGAQDKAKVFMWDSGNSVGELGGHAKAINSVSFKSSRPFRVCTGSEDFAVNFYSGPPFKFTSTAAKHSNFVNAVAFSPDGTKFLSAASDMFVRLFDGKEGTQLAEGKVHKGTVYQAVWSPDSSRILTASADKSIKVLDGTTLEEKHSVDFGKTPLHMAVGCAWAASQLVAYTLNGTMHIFDADNPAAPPQVQYGHTKAISALLWHAGSGRLLSAGFDSPDEGKTLTGAIRLWDPATGIAANMEGAGHKTRVMKLGAFADGTVVSLSLDESVFFSQAGEYGSEAKLPEGHCPKDMGVGSALAAVVTTKDHVVLLAGGKVVKSHQLGVSPSAVDVSTGDKFIAVGHEDGSVAILDNNCVQIHNLAQHREAVSAVSFSPDGVRLATGCANKTVIVWDAANGAPLVTGLDGFHRARISCFAWSAGGVLASAGVDAMIIVWDLEAKAAKQKIVNSHSSGGVNAITFINENTMASAGSDACIKTWTV